MKNKLYLALCLILLSGCDENPPELLEELALPGLCDSKASYGGRRDYGKQIKSLDVKLFLIAEKLERIAIVLEKVKKND